MVSRSNTVISHINIMTIVMLSLSTVDKASWVCLLENIKTDEAYEHIN